jgi:hypothetical protein
MAAVPDAEAKCSAAVNNTTAELLGRTDVAPTEPATSTPPSAQPLHSAQNQGGQGLGPCFKCGMSGHLTRHCPTKPSATRTGSQLRPQGQQNYTYGKVNHVSTEEAQQAQDVVLGMFLASSHSTTVLFNSGASHSFISSSFVVRHQLPITIMKQIMLVSSPRGEMQTKHICPAISITIRG